LFQNILLRDHTPYLFTFKGSARLGFPFIPQYPQEVLNAFSYGCFFSSGKYFHSFFVKRKEFFLIAAPFGEGW